MTSNPIQFFSSPWPAMASASFQAASSGRHRGAPRSGATPRAAKATFFDDFLCRCFSTGTYKHGMLEWFIYIYTYIWVCENRENP